MNRETKQITLLAYVIVFILVTLLSTSDTQMMIAQVLVSMLFGIGATLIDDDLRKRRGIDRIKRIVRDNKW